MEHPKTAFIRTWLLFFLLTTIVSCSVKSTGNNKITLNYIEYNRGKSFPLRADLRMLYDENNLLFRNIYFEDFSFFPDNSIIPNTFIKPLLQLQIGAFLDAFTEPYYGIRFIHFFKNNPHLGIGLEFIHQKIFLDNPSQKVSVSGSIDSIPVNEVVPINKYVDYFSVSHGINHLGFIVVYRMLLLRSSRIPDGRIQPFFSLSAGPTIPHLELKLAETFPKWETFAYQPSFRNFGLGAGTGIRFKLSRHFSLYCEYKLTYSHLHGMDLEDRPGSSVKMQFLSHHLLWGLAYIF